MKVLSLIKRTDYLGESIHFTINESSNFQTVHGGILSILLYTAYIYFFFYFGLDFFLNTNPNTYSQIKYPINGISPSLNLTEMNFILGVRMEDFNGNIINISDILYLEAFHDIYEYDSKDDNFTEYNTKIDMVSCNNLKFSDINLVFFNMSTFFCFDPKKLNKISLTGYYNDLYLSNLRLNFLFCKDNEATQCKNISNFLKNLEEKDPFLLTFVYPQVFYDPENYTHPLSTILVMEIIRLDYSNNGVDEIFIRKTILEDDKGIMFEIKDKIEFNGISNMKKFDTTRKRVLSDDYFKENKNYSESDRRLHQFLIFFEQFHMMYNRKYMKLQDVLGNVSGFMELILFIVGIFYKFYNKFRLDSFLFNRLVYIRAEDSIKKIEIHKKFPSSVNRLNKANNIQNKSFLETYNITGYIQKNVNYNQIKDYSKKDDEGKSEIKDLISSRQFKKIENLYRNPEYLNHNYYREKINCLDLNISLSNENKNKKIFRGIFNKCEILKLNIDKIHEGLTKYKNNIDFNFFSYIKNIVCKSKHINEYRFLESCNEKINKKFDIIYYLNKIKEFQMIKKILLKERNSNVIKILSKKFLFLDSYSKSINNPNSNIKKTLRNLLYGKQEEIESVNDQKILDLLFNLCL